MPIGAVGNCVASLLKRTRDGAEASSTGTIPKMDSSSAAAAAGGGDLAPRLEPGGGRPVIVALQDRRVGR